MERFAVVKSLPDKFRLEIFTDHIFDIQGNWQVSLNIDKSAVQANTLVVTPKIKASVTSGWEELYSHNITVDKVFISPFGNQLVLSEMVKDCKSLQKEDFALQDDQGHFLDIVPSQRFSGLDGKTLQINMDELCKSGEI